MDGATVERQLFATPCNPKKKIQRTKEEATDAMKETKTAGSCGEISVVSTVAESSMAAEKEIHEIKNFAAIVDQYDDCNALVVDEAGILLVLTGTACPRSSSQPAIKELRQEFIIVVPQTKTTPEPSQKSGEQPQPPRP